MYVKLQITMTTILMRKLKNETEDEIRALEKAIERCKANISRLKETKQFDPKLMIDRNKDEILKYEKQLVIERQKLDEIETGSYVDVLTQELDQNKQAIQTKTEQTKRRKVDKIKIKSTPSTNNYRKRPSEPGMVEHFQDKNLKREMDIAERIYMKDASSVPDYLLEKLDNMPNNMGYIWRNIWCFGRNPPQAHSNECIMYEKNYSQFLVHVINTKTREYCIYEKDGSNRKHLVKKSILSKLS